MTSHHQAQSPQGNHNDKSGEQATPQEVYALIRDVLIELFEFTPEEVTPTAHIVDDLDLDSIDAVDIIVKIQERTGKAIDPESFKQIQTIQDMVDIACR